MYKPCMGSEIHWIQLSVDQETELEFNRAMYSEGGRQ